MNAALCSFFKLGTSSFFQLGLLDSGGVSPVFFGDTTSPAGIRSFYGCTRRGVLRRRLLIVGKKHNKPTLKKDALSIICYSTMRGALSDRSAVRDRLNKSLVIILCIVISGRSNHRQGYGFDRIIFYLIFFPLEREKISKFHQNLKGRFGF